MGRHLGGSAPAVDTTAPALERRTVLRWLFRAAGLVAGSYVGGWRSRAAALSPPAGAATPVGNSGPAVAPTASVPTTPTLVDASRLGGRAVSGTDASALQTIMASSVRSESAFFGKCGEWSLGWAADLVARAPNTVVLTSGGTPVAFLEIPSIRSAPPTPTGALSAAARESLAVRKRNRTTFRVTAAGIRDDLLSPNEALRVFRQVLYSGFVRARQLGYEHVEAFAPWEQHPRMARKWTDYPGCVLVEPVAKSQGQGRDVYWLRWKLDDAIAALAAEGAADVRVNAIS